jgi:hypothetical protein
MVHDFTRVSLASSTAFFREEHPRLENVPLVSQAYSLDFKYSLLRLQRSNGEHPANVI